MKPAWRRAPGRASGETPRSSAIARRRPDPRRGALHTIIVPLAAVLAAAAPPAAGQGAWPAKPVRLIMAYPPGGSTDALGRMVARALTESWPHPVVAENRPGAGGSIGTAACARAPADGYTMCTVSPAQSVASRLSATAGFDSLKDLAQVSLVAELPLVLLAHPSLPVKSVQELVSLAKRRPGALGYASSGGGSLPQLLMELLKQQAGIDVLPVFYRGAGAQIADQLAGRVELSFSLAVGMLPYVREGRLRALAVSTTRRLSSLPAVPTLQEAGQKGVSGSSWLGIAMPAGVPREIVQKVGGDIARAVHTPELRDRIQEMGGLVAGSTPDEFAAFWQSESDKWTRVARSANVTLD